MRRPPRSWLRAILAGLLCLLPVDGRTQTPNEAALKVALIYNFALFVDCDVLFLGDVAELFALADPTKAVQVVKHGNLTAEGLKMDGVPQVRNGRDWVREKLTTPVLGWGRLTPNGYEALDGGP